MGVESRHIKKGSCFLVFAGEERDSGATQLRFFPSFFPRRAVWGNSIGSYPISPNSPMMPLEYRTTAMTSGRCPVNVHMLQDDG